MLKIILLSFLVFSFSSFASFEEKYNGKIKAVYVNSSSEALIKVEGVSSWLNLGKTDNSYTQSMMSIALTGKVSDSSEMWIRWTKEPHGSYPKVLIVSMSH
ncbi:hypothetical protein [Pseudoalteromonas luteoviolacea]|uniref:Uncharacterized protein n=1 Tax=Pseudoalteromonas luteoviolacea S4054 TaxID=1129367 RepID=A0A0F6AGN9_9GAMM|nr:hypothetical protein [Pseudoalteromonas luteoviolacea]AOT07195.1 hypothetical protein S4054249_04685 [Pseudoalteromonas luteoviolacea]AOT12111.1 hypothetical protein S40542_04685 [Pseudoalteromonas luteoviolacea]AOT17024.1 hypothetical protein S4054_04685 [Pseudoalteromonas luteoviolacea]KKE85380.1 hypothetical protein N479_05095 [Pseudoalteromonas luteoviolacea S4054]KZN73728.1 hypothetical protein N481_11505 [Pseudoalteromonas luteoviolacea S4047-1]